MRRRACVSLPDLPAQVLERLRPELAGAPLAAVTHVRPNGRVVSADRQARRRGVREGQTVAQAQALAPTLEVGAVHARDLDRAIADVRKTLRRTTPDVEADRARPGTFHLAASGLGLLHEDLGTWAAEVSARLAGLGYRACVVVGWTRFGTWAIAQAASGVVVLDDPLRERETCGGVRLERLGLDPKTRDALEELGLETVDALVTLGGPSVRQRFGTEAFALHRAARGELERPVHGDPRDPPPRRVVPFEPAERDATRLLFRVKSVLADVLSYLAASGRRLVALELALALDDGGLQRVTVRPATATRDEALVLDLVRLRLDARPPEAPIVELRAVAWGERGDGRQLDLLADDVPPRDRARAARALARVRAELGDDRVGRWEVRDAHLPEARAGFSAFDGAVEVPEARAVAGAPLRMVRRAPPKPWPLPQAPTAEGIDTLGHDRGGPYELSGGWWAREVHREYRFVERDDGALVWVFWDEVRGRWALQGEVR